MSQTLPNMLENTIAKIREMVDVNSVIGDPITTADGVTIIPVSKVSVGFGGGGSDFVSKNVNRQENPFGGGAGGGVKVTPIAFLIVKDGNVRMLPVATLPIPQPIGLWSRCPMCWIRSPASSIPEWRKRANNFSASADNTVG